MTQNLMTRVHGEGVLEDEGGPATSCLPRSAAKVGAAASRNSGLSSALGEAEVAGFPRSESGASV